MQLSPDIHIFAKQFPQSNSIQTCIAFPPPTDICLFMGTLPQYIHITWPENCQIYRNANFEGWLCFGPQNCFGKYELETFKCELNRFSPHSYSEGISWKPYVCILWLRSQQGQSHPTLLRREAAITWGITILREKARGKVCAVVMILTSPPSLLPGWNQMGWEYIFPSVPWTMRHCKQPFHS